MQPSQATPEVSDRRLHRRSANGSSLDTTFSLPLLTYWLISCYTSNILTRLCIHLTVTLFASVLVLGVQLHCCPFAYTRSIEFSACDLIL